MFSFFRVNSIRTRLVKHSDNRGNLDPRLEDEAEDEAVDDNSTQLRIVFETSSFQMLSFTCLSTLKSKGGRLPNSWYIVTAISPYSPTTRNQSINQHNVQLKTGMDKCFHNL